MLGLWLVVLGVAATHAPRVARLVRGAALEIVPLDFVQAAEARGDRVWSILGREILPNIWVVVLVDFGVRLSGSIIIISGLSFLGLGIPPPGVGDLATGGGGRSSSKRCEGAFFGAASWGNPNLLLSTDRSPS